jgi:two-component system alkaline phosphatase synthesis response regulator PhoP
VKCRLLLIEDDTNLASMLAARLRHEGYDIEVCASGGQGLDRAGAEESDIIILDVMLPDKTGFEVCTALRSRGVRKPVLMLTARGEVDDRVTGLRLGADDYLTKPFDVAELIARLEALGRRSTGHGEGPAARFRFRDIEVDFVARKVTRGVAPVHLSGRELALLEFFILHPNVVWSRDELLRRVWGYHRLPYTRTVDLHVAQLRQKLEEDPKDARYFMTVHGEGYRFAQGS